jgi:ADP-heptose:LPS heptosyltransferase
MSWKRTLLESQVWAWARFIAPSAPKGTLEPKKIFVLRNNDIGDLLIITPIFEALKRRFPNAWIAAGIGKWNTDVLKGNPFIDEIIEINAPWANKYTSGQGLRSVLTYIFRSPESNRLKNSGFDVGFDILGSHFGSMLLMRANIRLRLGVKGYRGGYSATYKWIEFDPAVHVGKAALSMAGLLGVSDAIENRPRLYLDDEELKFGERTWRDLENGDRSLRVLVGPGGGFPAKCWPATEFRDLVSKLEHDQGSHAIIVGGSADSDLGQFVSSKSDGRATSLCGKLTLRQTFALAATCDLVIANSSALMHIAAAFSKPTAVTLSDYYASASAHDRLWGYPGTCKSLGIEPGVRSSIWTYEEVAELVCSRTTSHSLSV